MLGYDQPDNSGPQITTTQNPSNPTETVITASEENQNQEEGDSYTQTFWETLEEHSGKIAVFSSVMVVVDIAYTHMR